MNMKSDTNRIYGTIRKLFFIGIILGIGAANLFSSVMVFPFRVDANGEKSHQWLGRAVSVHITIGLELNGIPVVPEHRSVALLESRGVNFPYSVSRASLIRLAKEYKATKVVCGEIHWDAHDLNKLQISASVVDLETLVQVHIPVIQGRLKDFFQMREDLMVSTLKAMSPTLTDSGSKAALLLLPKLNLKQRSYEIFIKGLLIKDPVKRIEMLTQPINVFEDSELLNFELAKAYYEVGDITKSGTYLKKIPRTPPNPLLEDKILFLDALSKAKQGNTDEALDIYLKMQDRNEFYREIQHNIGVIYANRNDFGRAVHYFKNALGEYNYPRTWYYYIASLFLMDDLPLTTQELTRALRMYPENENFVSLLSYVITRHENRDALFTLFDYYISDFYVPKKDERPSVTFKAVNPFIDFLYAPYPVSSEMDGMVQKPGNGESTSTDDDIEKIQEYLSVNPFKPEYYRLLSELYLKDKDFYKAEIHALGAVFLEQSDLNYKNLIAIYEGIGKKNLADELKFKLNKK